MGWELRSNRWYFYTKTRRGDRVVSEYVGLGDVATLIEASQGIRRCERDLAAFDWQSERDHDRAVDRLIAQQHRIVMTLARAYLLINGCHTHKGQWRKARE